MSQVNFELQAIRDYLHCSLYYYLRHQAKAASLPEAGMTTADLPGEAVLQALAVYAAGEHPGHSLPDLARAVWAAWLRRRGVQEDTLAALAGYEAQRRQALAPFFSGELTKRGGQRYIEPRLAPRYRQMTASAGLTAAAERLEDELLPVLQVAPAELDRLGRYPVAEAYADAVLMAERYPLPDRAAVLGINKEVSARTANGFTLRLKAPLLLREPDGSVTAFSHLAEPLFYFEPIWAGRQLEALALSLVSGGDGFGPVSRVVIRHLMSGQTVVRRQLRHARLSLAILHALRGIQAGIYLPHFLSGDLGRCRRCSAGRLCLSAEGDPLEAGYPGTLAWSERVMAAAQALDQEQAELLAVLDANAVTAFDLVRYLEGRRADD